MSLFSRFNLIRGHNSVMKNLIFSSFKNTCEQDAAVFKNHKLTRNFFGFGKEMKFPSKDPSAPIHEPNKSQTNIKKDRNSIQKVDDNNNKLINNNIWNYLEKSNGYKNEWGVKLSNDLIKPMITDDHVQNFVLKRKWGVTILKTNLHEAIKNKNSIDNKSILNDFLKNDNKVLSKSDRPPPIIDSMNISSVLTPSSDIEIEEEDEDEKPLKNINKEQINNASKKLEIPSSTLLLTNENSINPELDYYTTKDLLTDDELSAWKDVVKKTIIHNEEIIESKKNKLIQDNAPQIFSIPPEPPTKIYDDPVVKTFDIKHDKKNYNSNNIINNQNPFVINMKNILVHDISTRKFHTISSWFLATSIKNNNSNEICNLPVQIFDITEKPIDRLFGNYQIESSSSPSNGLVKFDSDKKPEDENINEEIKKNDDDDFVHAPGDPYPFNRDNYEKWKLPHGSDPLNRQPTE
ncbi:hypothetical protein HCN44_009617 [Aphidius gifuensis]|uniref:Uncharacterized protein n=1 Tax=Aphidius gifuensis TaxID=684658 RepID=A0A835CVL7_APHGI|nr:probable serine/threonine-protein kinase DDB_G0282963 [Aphidius gifuensis]KAF7998219.1 hypothetical protein HCN44_009617 [Aphidius gifuensis]